MEIVGENAFCPPVRQIISGKYLVTFVLITVRVNYNVLLFGSICLLCRVVLLVLCCVRAYLLTGVLQFFCFDESWRSDLLVYYGVE